MEKLASVLILIYNNSILFTKRNKNLKIHPGEVSFPGGRFDPQLDKNLLDTALRETEEEIGVTRDKIEIIDRMKPFYTLITDIKVIPYIGKLKIAKFNFKLNENEVEKIIIIPIKHLLNPKFKVRVPLKFRGEILYNTFYYYKNYLIWGATSRILDVFLNEYLSQKDPAQANILS